MVSYPGTRVCGMHSRTSLSATDATELLKLVLAVGTAGLVGIPSLGIGPRNLEGNTANTAKKLIPSQRFLILVLETAA
eukprot:1787061-Rhodomonas_salina.3